MSSNLFENPEGEIESGSVLSGGSKEIYQNGDDDDISLHLSSDSGGSYIDDLEESDGEQVNDDQILSFSDDDEDDMGIEDDIDEGDDFRDALRSAGNFRVKNKKPSASSKSYWRRKMMRTTNRELDPEVRINLSQANEAFVRNDFEQALKLYLEVIKKDSKNFSAYKTLGEIYKQQGRLHKCCNTWLLAANIHPWDSEFWASVGELSSQLGHIDQAIYCYGKAIHSDNSKNPKYIIERALLYKESKQYGRALEGFQKLHQMYPTDTNIIKNLASIYVEQKRINDAINLYMRILDKNINQKDSQQQSVPKFGWAELNILCELYLQKHSWRNGVKMIKLVSRWIQDRLGETWWDDVDDDSEFDRRRFNVLKSLTPSKQAKAKDKFFELPIDIRFKLGCLRLGLNQKEEAMRHFEYLLQETEDISDLFFDAGKVLEAHGSYEDALAFLTRASLSEQQGDNFELVSLLGKCFQEVGDFQQAEQAYRSLLYAEPDNLDVKLSLAEVLYHLGENEQSIKLLEDVSIAAQKDHNAPESDMEQNYDIQEDEPDNLSLIKNRKLIKPKNSKMSEEEKIEFEENATRKVLDKYRRMERLYSAVLNEDPVAVKTWMQLASQLIEVFMAVRIFFPRDKNRTFKGIVLYRRRKQMGLDEKLARVFNLYEGIVNDEDIHSRSFLTSTTEYRGISYDTWFCIFINYALFLSRFENNLEYALQIIDIAKDVNVFVQDKAKESMLNMVKLILGIRQGDMSSTVMTQVRYFLASNQFSPYIYDFFMCCFASGAGAWETFANYNHQKFFLRQLKSYDSIITGKRISGMATITADLQGFNAQGESPQLLYVYANLLGGSRSYVSSIVYLNRAYRHHDRDPMICLVLGLAHVHRSMQRLSTNRHIQLLQGISYLLEYKDHRKNNSTAYELQEIEYNFGRLFHMLGLTTAALYHYEKVLEFHESLEEDIEYDLSMEAVYNMTLIYNINGNSMLARELTEKYLTI